MTTISDIKETIAKNLGYESWQNAKDDKKLISFKTENNLSLSKKRDIETINNHFSKSDNYTESNNNNKDYLDCLFDDDSNDDDSNSQNDAIEKNNQPINDDYELIINGEIIESDDKFYDRGNIISIIKSAYKQADNDRKANEPDLLIKDGKFLIIEINTEIDYDNQPSKRKARLERGGGDFEQTSGIDAEERRKASNGENEKRESFYPISNTEKITSIIINGIKCLASIAKVESKELTEEEKSKKIIKSANREKNKLEKHKLIASKEWQGKLDQSLLVKYKNKELEISSNTFYEGSILGNNIIYKFLIKNVWVEITAARIITTGEDGYQWQPLATLGSDLELKNNRVYCDILNRVETPHGVIIKQHKGSLTAFVNGNAIAVKRYLGYNYNVDIIFNNVSLSKQTETWLFNQKQFIKNKILKYTGSEYHPEKLPSKQRKSICDKIKTILKFTIGKDRYKNLSVDKRDNIVSFLLVDYEQSTLAYQEIMSQLRLFEKYHGKFEQYVLNKVGFDLDSVTYSPTNLSMWLELLTNSTYCIYLLSF